MRDSFQLGEGESRRRSTDDRRSVADGSRRHPDDASLLQTDDASPATSVDTAVAPRETTGKICDWCRCQLQTTRPEGRFCSRKCRQTAWRLRRRHQVETRDGSPLRFAYADPPYPVVGERFYKDEPTYAGEVDHVELIASLTTSYDGWALSTSARSLRDVLPMCPPAARVCAWVKPIGASPLTYGIHNTWEPLIVVVGRSTRPGKRDWLACQPARRGGTLPGRKPLAFCAWLFELLGMAPGDQFDDLFPGTGIVSRAWAEASRRPGAGEQHV